MRADTGTHVYGHGLTDVRFNETQGDHDRRVRLHAHAQGQRLPRLLHRQGTQNADASRRFPTSDVLTHFIVLWVVCGCRSVTWTAMV